MKRIILALVSATILSACVMGYRPIEPKRHVIANVYSVEPQIMWSSIETEKREMWTVDGSALQEVMFVKGLEDGEALMREPGQDRELPKFRSNMGPSEVMEFLVDTLSSIGAAQVRAMDLRPIKFGDAPGFRFELTFLMKDGLEMDGLAAGAVLDERLHLILYLGTRQYYFPKYKPHVEKIIESVRDSRTF